MPCFRFDPPAIDDYYLLEEAYESAIRAGTATQVLVHYYVFRGILFQIMVEEDPAPYKLAWAFADATARPLVEKLKAKPSRQVIEQLQQIITNAYDSLPVQLH
ncbi:hypothetical protein [Spirosoma koreense]